MLSPTFWPVTTSGPFPLQLPLTPVILVLASAASLLSVFQQPLTSSPFSTFLSRVLFIIRVFSAPWLKMSIECLFVPDSMLSTVCLQRQLPHTILRSQQTPLLSSSVLPLRRHPGGNLERCKRWCRNSS